MSYEPHNIPKISFTISSCKKATQEGELDEEEDTYNCQKPYKKWDSWVDVETQRPTHSRCFYSRTQMSLSMQSSYSKKIATEMEQRTGPGVGEKTTDKTQTHSHVKEDQEPSEMISAPQDSAQSDSDATNGKRRKETQSPSSEIDNGGWFNSDEKLGRISPSLPTQAEHETKNNSAGDHHTQEEEQQEEEEEEEKGRERLKRHQVEVAGQVWIPEIWGQEELLKDWVDCSVFEASLVPAKIFSAKAALAEEGRKANSGGLRIDNSC